MIDIQKYMEFMLFQEYRRYVNSIGTDNAINQKSEKPVEFDTWIEQHDLLMPDTASGPPTAD